MTSIHQSQQGTSVLDQWRTTVAYQCEWSCMDVCKVMTDTLHFVMNHSTALIFGDWRVPLGPLEDVELFFYRQDIQHQLSINQRSVKKKKKTIVYIFLRLLIKIITCLVQCFQRSSVQLGSLIFTG